MIRVAVESILKENKGDLFEDYISESNTLSFRMSNIRPGGVLDLNYNLKFLLLSF